MICLTGNASALLLTNGAISVISCSGFPHVDSCLLTSTTTSLPTVLVDDIETPIDSLEFLSLAVDETHLDSDKAKATQILALYYGATVSETQDAITRAYNLKLTLTLEAIRDQLL